MSKAEEWAEFADLVLIVAREIQFRGYEAPEALQLTPSEGAVMRSLYRNPGSLSSEVARATGLQRSNLSTVLRGLEEKQLIVRMSDSEDGRAVRIHPTDRAIDNFALVRREWASAVAAAAGPGAEAKAALPVLREIADGLVRLRQA